jgi:succinyl-diaminopimelate desuccinylase
MITYTMDLQQILEKLIAFKSISEDKEESKKALEWVAQQLPSTMHLTWHESNGFHSLVATTRDTTSPKVWLAAHIDVVPGNETLFSMREEDGKLIGRGAFDMKFAIAAYILLLQEMKEDLEKLDLGIMITSDEELIGVNGTKYLMDEGYGGEVVFLPDGGGDWMMQRSAKGAIRLEVVARGKTAHGSRPWEGENANRTLIHFLSDLHDIFDGFTCTDGEHYHNTINVGKMYGGYAVNQIPDYASALVDIRYVVETPRDKIMADIDELLKEYPSVEVGEYLHLSALNADLESKEVKLWQDMSKEMYNIDVGSVLAHGGSDANFFADKGMNVILVRPHGGGQHADSEWINAEDLDRYYHVLKGWVEHVAVDRG